MQMTEFPYSLDGRRILVTGASSGIGRATAILASRLGATVALTARRADELEATRQAMSNPEAHVTVAGDLTDTGFVRELVGKAGQCDGLVHAAGVSSIVPVGMISHGQLEKSWQLNCEAFVMLVDMFVRGVAQRVPNADHGCSIVAVSSVSASSGWSGGVAYCSSKGALVASVRAMAVELAPKGIRVNAVSPSGIRTPLYETQAAFDPEAARRRIAATQPLGIGMPEQVAAPICFLLSDAASFVTGVDLPVDGGYLAK